MNKRIPVEYAVLIVSEILMEKGLINRATFNEIEQKLKAAGFTHFTKNAEPNIIMSK